MSNPGISTTTAAISSSTLPSGDLTYFSDPAPHEIAGVVSGGIPWIVLLIIALWYFKPVASFIDRLKTLPTPWGDANAEPLQQTPVPTVDISKPPVVSTPELQTTESKKLIESRARDEYDAAFWDNIMKQTESWASSWGFERLYNELYGSQLRFLHAAYPNLSSVSAQFYAVASASGYTGSQDDWLAVLVNSNLIVKTPSKGRYAQFTLTERGRTFVQYILDQGLALDKPH